MPHNNPAVTLSVRVPPEVREQLDQLSDATGRTKSFLASEAIAHYLATQAWQVAETKQALDQANSKNATFTQHAAVTDWVNSWGDDNEQATP